MYSKIESPSHGYFQFVKFLCKDVLKVKHVSFVQFFWLEIERSLMNNFFVLKWNRLPVPCLHTKIRTVFSFLLLLVIYQKWPRELKLWVKDKELFLQLIYLFKSSLYLICTISFKKCKVDIFQSRSVLLLWLVGSWWQQLNGHAVFDSQRHYWNGGPNTETDNNLPWPFVFLLSFKSGMWIVRWPIRHIETCVYFTRK